MTVSTSHYGVTLTLTTTLDGHSRLCHLGNQNISSTLLRMLGILIRLAEAFDPRGERE